MKRVQSFQFVRVMKDLKTQKTFSDPLSPIFEDVLAHGADVKIRVSGPSMAPAIKDGDVVVIRRTGAMQLRPGDIILFRNSSGSLVLHRILKLGDIGGKVTFHTKGDAQHEYDHWVSDTDALGRVCRIEKKTSSGPHRHVDLDSRLWIIASRLMAPYQRLRSKFYLSLLPRLLRSVQ